MAAEVSPARAAAFDILVRVERERSYASELLHSQTYSRLTTIDHALATELVMGVLRWRSLLDSEIGGVSAQPIARLDLEILTTLRLGLYQLRWLTRVPTHAAINQSVEMAKRARKRSAASFVNAVLRKLARPQAPASSELLEEEASVEGLAAKMAHPEWLVRRWVTDYGFENTLRICRYNQTPPETSIRLRHSEAEERLRVEGVGVARGVLLSSARRVTRGNVARTQAFLRGLCSIQDEASQLVAALVGHGLYILDCCAAPGGKTAAIADSNPNATIVASEMHLHRARLLRQMLSAHSIESSGGRSIGVVAADARNLPFVAKFDRVLADVPCSGTGTLARNPEIKWRLVPGDIADLQGRQVEILRAAMTRVAAGGRVIYSTCSLEREENEEVVERALKADSSFHVVDCAGELEQLKQQDTLVWAEFSGLTRGPYLRTLPGVQPCDGFFAAILEKS